MRACVHGGMRSTLFPSEKWPTLTNGSECGLMSIFLILVSFCIPSSMTNIFLSHGTISCGFIGERKDERMQERNGKNVIFSHMQRDANGRGTKESSKLKQRKNPGILYVFIQLFFFFHFVFAASLNFTLLLLRGTEGGKERESQDGDICIARNEEN